MERPRVVNPHDLKLPLRGMEIPLGRWFLAITHLHGHDPLANQPIIHPGVSKAQEALQQSGVLFLDAHVTRAGIVATGVQLTGSLDVTGAKAPVTMRHANNPVINSLNEVPGVEIIPVVRSKDKSRTMGDEERKATNLEYKEKTLAALETPGHMVVIAPFGVLFEKRDKGREIMRGVNDVLDAFTGSVFCTLSERHWGRFTMAMSTAPLSLAGISRTERTNIINAEFAALKEMAQK